jgi:outer membrane protein OmpA-like peptidoglycan-associated protein
MGALRSTAPEPTAPAADTAMIADSFLPSLVGPVGLYNMSTAEVGPEQHLRFALHGQYFESSGFLVTGDANSRMNGNFSFGYTPNKYFEIFGAFLTSSNRNQRFNNFEPPRRDPELIKSFGDLVLGPKVVFPIATGMNVGFELGLRFLSSISDLSISPSSTSLWTGPLYTFDLRKVSKAPVRIHASANYYLDNSDNLINFSDPSISKYTREVAMFAYGIARNRLRFALGVDFPLEQLTAPVPLTPMLEYHAEVVTASADPAFMNEVNDTKNRDQHWMTIGLRARVYKGITADAGVDIRLRSVGYEYGTPLPPYNVIFGAAYPFDIATFTKPVIVTRTIERNVGGPVAAPLEGQVTGIVKSARDGRPIPGALIAAGRRPLSRVATDPDGTFQSVPLPPGPVELEVSAPGFDSTKVPTAVILGRPAKVEVTLSPRIVTGNVRGTVKDSAGHPLPAALRLAGAEIFSAQADTAGQFSASLPVGTYRVTADMPQMPSKEVTLDIVEGQDRTLDIVMQSGTGGGVATIQGDQVMTKQPVRFASGSRVDPKMAIQLDAVVALLQERQDVRLRIDTYWDSSAGKGAKALTDAQAAAIKAYLVKKGIAEGRIEASGHGAENPMVPNIGPVNKAKNRRVELRVQ